MENADVTLITRVMESNQEETRQQFTQLRESTATMAKAVADLTTTIARVEERHASHDDGLKRIGNRVDDHEKRTRKLEQSHVSRAEHEKLIEHVNEVRDQSLVRDASLSTSWKTITSIGCVAAFVLTLVFNLISPAS